MFKINKVIPIMETNGADRSGGVLTLDVHYTKDGDKHKALFLVYSDGNYRTSIEEILLEYYRLSKLKADAYVHGQEVGMTEEEFETVKKDLKELVELWCEEYHYPQLQKNLYSKSHDRHLL